MMHDRRLEYHNRGITYTIGADNRQPSALRRQQRAWKWLQPQYCVEIWFWPGPLQSRAWILGCIRRRWREHRKVRIEGLCASYPTRKLILPIVTRVRDRQYSGRRRAFRVGLIEWNVPRKVLVPVVCSEVLLSTGIETWLHRQEDWYKNTIWIWMC